MSNTTIKFSEMTEVVPNALLMEAGLTAKDIRIIKLALSNTAYEVRRQGSDSMADEVSKIREKLDKIPFIV